MGLTLVLLVATFAKHISLCQISNECFIHKFLNVLFWVFQLEIDMDSYAIIGESNSLF